MYTVLGYTNALDIENGCDAEDHVETIKDAKRIASYWMTDFEQPMERIIVKNSKGECVLDKY